MTKKKVTKAIDKLEAMGQKSEKQGIKWTQKFMDEFDKKELQKDFEIKDKLKKERKTKKGYYEALRKVLAEMVEAVDRPSPGFSYKVLKSDKGIVCQFKDTEGKSWTKAFKPCGIPKIDFSACRTIAGLADDKMWELDRVGSGGKTKSGIYLN